MNIKRPKSKQPIPNNAQRAFKGVLFDVYQWKQKMFNGSFAPYERLKRPDVVNILPIIENKILLTEEEQPGTGVFLASAGGRIDPEELPLAAAKRELLEETGYEAANWFLWDAVQPVAKIDYAVYTFIAKECTKISKQDLDPGEKIKLRFYNFDDFLKVVLQKNFWDLELSLKVARIKDSPKKLKEMKELFLE